MLRSAPALRPVSVRLLVLLSLALAVAAFGPRPGSGASPVPGPATAAAAKKPSSTSKKKKRKKPKYTVEGELRKLQLKKQITRKERMDWRHIYRAAVKKAKRMPKGTPKTELQAVVDNTASMAGRRKITASLAPSVFLTLQVNRRWWGRNGPPSDRRPPITGSPLTWQYYPGEGLQIQWLATFGHANALATTKTPAKLQQLRAIEDEALRLASQRAGGPTWQYLFDFGGGRPPWASGMAQVTAMQSLVRTTLKLNDPTYGQTALKAIALLRRSSPVGALYRRPQGDHILLYTFTRTRVLNAFTQAVSGLHEIAAATGDPQVGALYVRAERELRAELPEYDTGTWATYSLGGSPEPPSYHTLSRDLLRGLCRTLSTDAEVFLAGGGAGPQPAPAAPYCAMAERFTEDLRRTPNGPKSRAHGRAAARAPSGPATDPDPAARLGAPDLSQP